MKLNILERLLLLNMWAGDMPFQGRLSEIRAVAQLKQRVQILDEEREAIGFKVNRETGGVTWDTAKDEPVEIEITDEMLVCIQNRLTAFDKAGKLMEAHLPFYERFMAAGQTEHKPNKAQKNGKKPDHTKEPVARLVN